MIIEIYGAGFYNKGAELMLRETVRRIRQSMPEASIAVSARSGPFSARAQLGLLQIPRYRRYGFEWGKLAALMPARHRRVLGLVTDGEADVTLDASGYSYSAAWGIQNVKGLAARARRARRKDKRLVLLPQAFGPFTHPFKEPLAVAVENADLIYARDEVSYKWILDLVGESDNVRTAPDFTAPLPGFLPPEHEHLKGRFCLIPNRRMLDKTEAEVRNAYVPLMRRCLALALEHGAGPYILIHETNDTGLARQIADRLDGAVELVPGADARALKGIIGTASSVLSSRFHGLVNALCQGVPALGTAWSHKYDMLFRDYGIEEGVLPVPCPDGELETRLGVLLDPASRKTLAARLRTAAARQRQAIENMWSEVFSVIRGG